MSKLQFLLKSGQPVRIMAAGVMSRGEKKLRRRLGFGGRNTFIDRQKGHKKVLVIPSGYKQKLWEYTVPRLKKFVPDDVDVCLITPGLEAPEVQKIAEEHGWSFLSTRDNRIAQAQNLAIVNHPNAEWIYKVDEDMFITDGMLDRMKETYELAKADGKIDPGYIAPLINVNGHTYTILLELLGLEDEYLKEFGEIRSACMDVKMHAEAEPAPWIWERTTPLEETARRIAELNQSYSIIPHRFSIGAIGMERSFWEEMDGFQATLIEAHIGFHEEIMCDYCTKVSRPGIVARSAFVGHFSFYTQTPVMEQLLTDRPELFALPQD